MGLVSLVPSEIGKGTWSTNLGESPHVLGHAVHVRGWAAETVTSRSVPRLWNLLLNRGMLGTAWLMHTPPLGFSCHFGCALPYV